MKTFYACAAVLYLFGILIFPESDTQTQILFAAISIICALGYESLVIQDKIDKNKNP